MNEYRRTKCPHCYRLVAKELEGGLYQIKHRGMELLTDNAVVTCVGCQRQLLLRTGSVITEVKHGQKA